MHNVVEIPLMLKTEFKDISTVVMAEVNFKGILPPEMLSRLAEGSVQLHETDSQGRPLIEVPVQVDMHASKVYWVLDEVDVAVKYYRLGMDVTRESQDERSEIEVEDDGKHLQICVDSKHFTTYNYADEWKPFFYPINTPIGGVVRGRGEEHPHHHGLWIAYGGERTGSTDLWSEVHEHSGRIVHKAFKKIVSGPVYAQFVEELQYVKPEGSEILEETRNIRVYNLPAKGRGMDIELKVSPPLDTGPRPLYLVCRVCDSMRVTELKKGSNVPKASRSANPGRIVNSQGYSVIEDVPSPVKVRWLFSELGTPASARWVDFSGPVGLGWAGVTLMDHPSNMGHPPQIVTRCYGLSAIGRRYPHGISQGVLELKYRVFIHLGDHKEAHVDRNYRAYVNPPEVEVGTPEYSQQ